MSIKRIINGIALINSMYLRDDTPAALFFMAAEEEEGEQDC